MMDPLPIKPFVRPASSAASVPGSKSLTNRALLMAALCPHTVVLEGALFSEDTEIMGNALRALGISVEMEATTRQITVQGCGGKIPAQTAELFVGLAGTAARFLTALCAAAPSGVYTLDGTEQMRRRPMAGLLATLRSLGADIRCLGEPECFPFRIHARGLRGGEASLDARDSSQMLSALLMVAPLAKAPIRLRLDGAVRWPFVAMTLRQMAQFGQISEIQKPAAELLLPWGKSYTLSGKTSYTIEPDATAASYFLALPIAVGGCVRQLGLPDAAHSLQGDVAFADVMRKVGLSVRHEGGALISEQPSQVSLGGVDADFNLFSDTFLTLAALSPLLRGPTLLRGLSHTRKQETDRVAGMAAELRRLGQKVVETDDALEIHPQPLLRDVEIETYGDHRFAMSFGILGSYDLKGDGTPWLRIRNPGCCRKTFPNFFEELASVWRQSHSA